MDIRFQQLESLHWLWAVAALVVVVVVGFHLRRRALQRFATSGLLEALLARVSPGRQVVRAILVLAALPCLVAAMIDPRWGVTYQPVQQRGIDIVVVLDLSRSMLAEDVKPNRVDRAKQFIGDLVERLGGDRIALVTFAGTATIACPLTVDYGAFLLTLDVASVETVPRGGSLLGDAIRVAGKAFTDEVPDHKAIVIFSDGEDQGSYPRQAVESLEADLPVPIYTVGIGDAEEGARIPVTVDERGRRRARTYVTYEGQEVWTKLDAALLRAIALDSGGAYVPVGTGTVDMGRVYDEKIEPVAKREYEVTERKLYQARYQWFAGLALVLLLVESFMSDRRVEKSTARAVAEAVRNRPLGPRTGKKSRLAALALAALPVLLGTGPANGPAPPASAFPKAAADASPRKLAAEAARAMQDQRYTDAIALYDRLRGVLPDTPEIPYNQGVAAYRAGDLERAEAFFRQTLDVAEDPMLRAQSAYNLGTTAHRRTLEQTSGSAGAAAGAPPGALPGALPPAADSANPAGGAAPTGNPIGEAMEELDRAIAHYRDALDAEPTDLDARANAEMAWNLRQQLEQMRQQQQQQQEGEGDDKNEQEQDEQQDQQQNQQGEQSEDQQDQSQSQSGEDQQDQQGEQSPEQQESEAEQDQPQSGEEEQEQEQEQEQPHEQDQPAAGEEQEQEPQTAQGEQEQQQDEPRRMSREEAERLLQGVRDKERRRREELARREASRLPPVTKDW